MRRLVTGLLLSAVAVGGCSSSSFSETTPIGAATDLSIEAAAGVTLPSTITFKQAGTGSLTYSGTMKASAAASELVTAAIASGKWTLQFSPPNEAANTEFSAGSKLMLSTVAGFLILWISAARREITLFLLLSAVVCWSQCTTTVEELTVTTPFGWTCSGALCAIDKCGAPGTGKVFQTGKTAESVCRADCATTCFQDPVCTCSNGVAAIGAACTSNGLKCASCSTGFQLAGDACTAIACSGTGIDTSSTAGACACAAGYSGTVTYDSTSITGGCHVIYRHLRLSNGKATTWRSSIPELKLFSDTGLTAEVDYSGAALNCPGQWRSGDKVTNIRDGKVGVTNTGSSEPDDISRAWRSPDTGAAANQVWVTIDFGVAPKFVRCAKILSASADNWLMMGYSNTDPGTSSSYASMRWDGGLLLEGSQDGTTWVRIGSPKTGSNTVCID